MKYIYKYLINNFTLITNLNGNILDIWSYMKDIIKIMFLFEHS